MGTPGDAMEMPGEEMGYQGTPKDVIGRQGTQWRCQGKRVHKKRVQQKDKESCQEALESQKSTNTILDFIVVDW